MPLNITGPNGHEAGNEIQIDKNKMCCALRLLLSGKEGKDVVLCRKTETFYFGYFKQLIL